jgi:hypothetical protein
LKPAIDNALAKTGQGQDGKVNIVAHSTGGLLVRAYLRGHPDRKNQINLLALVGTPNQGSVNPYYMYYGGDPKKADDTVEPWYKEVMNFYSNTTQLTYSAMHHNELLFPRETVCTSNGCASWTLWDNAEAKKKARKFIQEEVPTVLGLLSLLPFIKDDSGIHAITDNTELKELNDKFDLADMVDRVKIFAGRGQDTIWAINVGEPNGMYPYGIPISAEKNKAGDGTVPLSSATLSPLVSTTKDAGHGDLINAYSADLIAFLLPSRAAQGTPSTYDKRTSKAATPKLTLSLHGPVTPYLTDPTGKKLGINPSTGLPENTFAQAALDLDSVSSELSISSPVDGTYTVQLHGSFSRDYRMEIGYLSLSGGSDMVSAIGFNHANTTTFTFSLNSSADPKLALALGPAAPSGLTAQPFNSGGLKTRLTWQASGDSLVTLYRVYSRKSDEPFMSLLGSSTSAAFDTSHPWSADSTITPRFYAVTDVRSSGVESFLSEWAVNNDRDHDGLTDEEETLFGSDMNKADTDGDGLNDAEEYVHGTNPNLKDTDGDGFSDAFEVKDGSDPLDPKSKPRAKLGGVLLLLLE